MEVISAREGGACNNGRGAATMAAHLFVSTSVIRSHNQPSEKRSLGFPGGAVVKNLPANAGDTGSSPGLGGSHMPRSN